MPHKRTIPRTCEHCSSPFMAPKGEVVRGRGRFCNRLCVSQSRVKTDTIPCGTCGRKFVPDSYEIKRGVGTHCSRYCATRRPRPGRVEIIDDVTARIPLITRSGEVKGYALIDAADADWAKQWQWKLDRNGYAARGTRGKDTMVTVLLHRALLGLTPGDGFAGDHINRNRLDNRRSNLRVVPLHANAQNTSQRGASGHRGVTWYAPTSKWRAQISAQGKKRHLGYFATKEAAAEAALQARRQLLPYAVD